MSVPHFSIFHFTHTRLWLWLYSTITKLLPKLLIVVAILVSLPSFSFDCHSDGSFIGAYVTSAASIVNFEEYGIRNVRELEQSKQGVSNLEGQHTCTMQRESLTVFIIDIILRHHFTCYLFQCNCTQLFLPPTLHTIWSR